MPKKISKASGIEIRHMYHVAVTGEISHLRKNRVQAIYRMTPPASLKDYKAIKAIVRRS
jgi:hypothetical protein